MNRDLSITFMDSDDAELEFHIRDLGDLMLQAYGRGDRAAADHWLKLQAEAIAGRTPGQVLKLEQEKGLV